LAKKQREFIFGKINFISDTFINYENYTNSVEYNKEIGYYFPLLNLKFLKNFDEFLYYKRRKVEILNVIANIGALFSTVKYCLSVLLHFYTTNFNNYKIIWKLLNSKNKQNSIVELDKEFKKPLTLKNKNFNDKIINDINNLDPLIEPNPPDINKNIKETTNDIDIDIIDSDETSHPFVLKKLSFFDFFFNNIYCKCCIKIRNQNLIDKTNEILYKYLSIDSLLYNQLKLENFFQDYTWNNQLLNDVKKNKMIEDLKNI